MVYLDMNSVLCTSINQSLNQSLNLHVWTATRGLASAQSLRKEVFQQEGIHRRASTNLTSARLQQWLGWKGLLQRESFAKGIFSEVERMERVTVFQWLAYHNLVTIDIAALLWHHYPTSPKPHEGLKFSLAWPSWIAAAVLPRYEKRSCLRRLTSIRRMGKTRPKNKKQPLHATWMN